MDKGKHRLAQLGLVMSEKNSAQQKPDSVHASQMP